MLFFQAGSSEHVTYISFDGKLYELILPEAFFADVKVVATAGEKATLASSNPAAAVVDETSAKQIYGMGGGWETTIVAMGGSTPAYLNVKVKRRRDYGRTILRLGNALALQNWDPVEPLNFANTMSAKPMENETDLLKRVEAAGPHDHLYISCHKIGGELRLGTGVKTASSFAPLVGKVGTIWVSGCAMLAGADKAWGLQFCSDIAKIAKCYVFACATAVLAMKPQGPEEIESFTEFSPTVFQPGTGEPLPGGENAYLRARVERNVKMTKLGPFPLK